MIAFKKQKKVYGAEVDNVDKKNQNRENEK